MEGKDCSTKGITSVLFNILLKLWTTSIVVAPVTFSFNSCSSFSFSSSSRLSFLPKILSPNVLSLVCEIGNVINKAPVIPNKAPVKAGAHIFPGILILRILFAFFHIIFSFQFYIYLALGLGE